MKCLFVALLTLAAALTSGCASDPRLPAAFDWTEAAILADAAEPDVVVDGPAGKGSGAGAGAAKGGGAGFLIGGLACMGAGPLAPLCLGALVPASTAIGAVGGAVAGALRADSAENVEAKRVLLRAALADQTERAKLAAQVQRQLRAAHAADLAGTDGGSTPPARPWTLRVAFTEWATVGAGPDAPYALQASARLDAQRAGDSAPVFVKHYRALSPLSMSTAQWQAQDALAARAALDALLTDLAAQMVGDLIGKRPAAVPSAVAANSQP
jgi:hypothetical protein